MVANKKNPTTRKVLFAGVAVLLLGLTLALLFQTSSWTGNHVSPVEFELSALTTALESYRTKNGSYPKGDSRTISRILSGRNEEEVVYIEWAQERISPEGDMLDRWGTPYDFILTEQGPVIRSAGKNRTFDSGDRGNDDYFYDGRTGGVTR